MHSLTTIIVGLAQAGCVNGDPFCAKLQTYAGWAPGWLQYVGIIGVIIGLVMGIIGHRQGWDHMRATVTAVVVASAIIGAAGTFF